MPTILEEANRLIYKERADQHGDAYNCYTLTGKLWGDYLGMPHIHPDTVCILMSLMKLARHAISEFNRDNLVDAAGYIGLPEKMIRDKEDDGFDENEEVPF